MEIILKGMEYENSIRSDGSVGSETDVGGKLLGV